MLLTLGLCILSVMRLSDGDFSSSEDDGTFEPTVLVAVLVRNKAHYLPWFFGQLEKLHYPKDRMALWIRSDHNLDNSTAMVKEWVGGVEHEYHSVDFTYDDNETAYRDERGPFDWTDDRFDYMIKLREQSLQAGRDIWADYILMIDADVMLENPDTLNLLVQQKKVIVGPMFNATVGSSYSNFWGDVDDEGYYKRIPEYFNIIKREITGCFPVAVVHTTFLIDLRHRITKDLSFLPPSDYDKPVDDIVIFAQSAIALGLPMHVLNSEYFGRVINPLDWFHSLDQDKEQFNFLRNEILDAANPDMAPGIDYIVEGRGLTPSPHISLPPLPTKDRLGFDEVYMINLERRPERRKRMQFVFDLLAIDAIWIPAVDGKKLNDSFLVRLDIYQLEDYVDPYYDRLLNDTYLTEMAIEPLTGFADPYFGRPMTMGEIGCFLSHYYIWQSVLKNNQQSVIVFEDDLYFEPYFRSKLKALMSDVEAITPDWDLIYLGRKRLNAKEEKYASGSKTVVWPSYSYWTLSYILSNKGARKLVDQKPLQKMIPVDEYLPVMFDKHPEDSWKQQFTPRNLVALSADPFLIYPTHYLGEANYISDTEDSALISSGDGDTNSEHSDGVDYDTMKGLKEGHIEGGIDGEQQEYNKDEL